MELEILIFECDGAAFGVPADRVREVIRAVAVSPVPHTHAAVLGSIDLRGELVRVISTRTLLNLKEAFVHPDHQFVILRSGNQQIAFQVDTAIGLTRVAMDGNREDQDRGEALVDATVQSAHGIVSVLAIDRIFSALQQRQE